VTSSGLVCPEEPAAIVEDETPEGLPMVAENKIK
jgi:hypothetical protein